jgi:SRSO17 transposase
MRTAPKQTNAAAVAVRSQVRPSRGPSGRACLPSLPVPRVAPSPEAYWLASLPADTPLEQLVGLAKLRWRVEHDCRELKDALGLDHFEGRSFTGWHHHVTLVSAAHGFVTLERLDPKAAASA